MERLEVKLARIRTGIVERRDPEEVLCAGFESLDQVARLRRDAARHGVPLTVVFAQLDRKVQHGTAAIRPRVQVQNHRRRVGLQELIPGGRDWFCAAGSSDFRFARYSTPDFVVSCKKRWRNKSTNTNRLKFGLSIAQTYSNLDFFCIICFKHKKNWQSL